MIQEEIEQSNKLIAEFMGFEKHPNNHYHCFSTTLRLTTVIPPAHMKFHYSWDWLIPVIHKINSVCLPSFNDKNNRKRIEIFKQVDLFSPIGDVYQCVIDFIKWYNETSK